MSRLIQWTIVGVVLVSMGCAGRVERPRSNVVRNLSPEASAVRSTQDEGVFHNKIGGLLFGQGNLEGALREIREAIRLSPENPVLHNNLGLVFHAQGDFINAKAEFQEAIRLKPHNATARGNLGFACFERGEWESAVDQWQVAVKQGPQLAGAWEGLALGLLAFGYVDQAIQSFSQAHQLDSRYADVKYLRSIHRWSPGALEQAEAILRIIKARNEEPPQTILT